MLIAKVENIGKQKTYIYFFQFRITLVFSLRIVRIFNFLRLIYFQNRCNKRKLKLNLLVTVIVVRVVSASCILSSRRPNYYITRKPSDQPCSSYREYFQQFSSMFRLVRH